MASRQGGPGAGRAPGIDSHRTSVGSDLLTEQGPLARSPPNSSTETPEPARRRRPEDPPLRDPRSYAQTDHFRERLHQQGRYVSLPVVSEAIAHGQLRWNTTDGWRFALVRDGVRFIVVVSDTETSSPVVVTGWTEVADWSEAVASERWNEIDVHTIQLRADLSDNHDEQIPELIRPRTVARPFEVSGHRLVTEAGRGYVECVGCCGRFRSKADLCTRRCND